MTFRLCAARRDRQTDGRTDTRPMKARFALDAASVSYVRFVLHRTIDGSDLKPSNATNTASRRYIAVKFPSANADQLRTLSTPAPAPLGTGRYHPSGPRAGPPSMTETMTDADNPLAADDRCLPGKHVVFFERRRPLLCFHQQSWMTGLSTAARSQAGRPSGDRSGREGRV